MRSIILYYHVAPLEDYMKKTKRVMDEIDRHHQSAFKVVDCMTRKNSNDMGLHLGRYWGMSDLFIIGQDNVPSIVTLYQMKLCDEDLCVNPCISYPPSTALHRPVLNQIDRQGKIYEMNERPKTVYYCGTGISKISLAIQKAIKPKSFDWGFPAFDSHLKDLGLVDWHCHYPIHEHTKDKMKYAHWTAPT